MSKKQKVNNQPVHGGHSGLVIPDAVRSQTQGSLPYDHDAVRNSSARTGLQSGKKK
jgi:hypothetical protein